MRLPKKLSEMSHDELTEEMVHDTIPFFGGIVFGLVAIAYGAIATGTIQILFCAWKLWRHHRAQAIAEQQVAELRRVSLLQHRAESIWLDLDTEAPPGRRPSWLYDE